MVARWLAAMAVVSALALGGCAFILDSPTVSVTEVQAGSMGLTGGTLKLRLTLENPNPFDFSAESFDYRFDIGDGAGSGPDGGGSTWTTIFDGVYEEAVEIPGDGTTTVEVEVPFQYASVGTVVGRLLRQGQVEYRFSGLFRFHVLVGGFDVPFDEQGTFRP